jgi:hypothetical protein
VNIELIRLLAAQTMRCKFRMWGFDADYFCYFFASWGKTQQTSQNSHRNCDWDSGEIDFSRRLETGHSLTFTNVDENLKFALIL